MKSLIDKIDKRQYGSLKKSSTTHVLLSFIHHILSRSDDSKNVIRIFLLDFAKAFDHIGLGPILFLVMVNDLLEEWQDRWKYVDDTSTIECIEANCPSHLQDVVNEVVTWTINNNMKLNISKCKEIIVDFAKDKRPFRPLPVSGNPIRLVESDKILGLIVQNNLKWNLHVDHIVKKASKP